MEPLPEIAEPRHGRATTEQAPTRRFSFPEPIRRNATRYPLRLTGQPPGFHHHTDTQERCGPAPVAPDDVGADHASGHCAAKWMNPSSR
jgi:hypothetical protein